MADTDTEVTTGSVLQGMLTENTGRHFLDSGDAYGRAWERNQGRSFADEQPATVTWKYGIDVTLNVYHFLAERLDYELAADAAWLAWGEAREDEAWLASAQEWVAAIGGRGFYGEDGPVVINTYNGEDLLSQTIQYVLFSATEETVLPRPAKRLSTAPRWRKTTLDPGYYALLQIHGGADVRGGYTRPRLFRVPEELALFDNAHATILCTSRVGTVDNGQDKETCNAVWDTNDAYHWYYEGSAGLGAGTQLEAYDRVEIDFTETPVVGNVHPTDLRPNGEPYGNVHPTDEVEDEDDPRRPENRVGKLVIDTDSDTAYCPRCGVGTLDVSPVPS